MPGYGLTGRVRNLGIHRQEQIGIVWPELDQDQLVGEAYKQVMTGPEATRNGVMVGPVAVDPDVSTFFPPRINQDEPAAVIFDVSDGNGDHADDALGAYVNLEGETRQSHFAHIAIVPMQLAQMDKQYGWRQDTEMDDIAWPYRLIAGVDYSGPAHPQFSNVWQQPTDFGVGQGNYDQFTTQTPLFPVDVALAFPLDHPIAGDQWGIIGPNEHA
jgi:hypothetical protein